MTGSQGRVFLSIIEYNFKDIMAFVRTAGYVVKEAIEISYILTWYLPFVLTLEPIY
jgi:hypothetical protein